MILLLSFQAVLVWLAIHCRKDAGIVISSIVLFLLISLFKNIIF